MRLLLNQMKPTKTQNSTNKNNTNKNIKNINLYHNNILHNCHAASYEKTNNIWQLIYYLCFANFHGRWNIFSLHLFLLVSTRPLTFLLLFLFQFQVSHPFHVHTLWTLKRAVVALNPRTRKSVPTGLKENTVALFQAFVGVNLRIFQSKNESK